MTSHNAYEAAKSEWLAAHPNATAREVEDAFKAIAERLGI